MADRRAMELNSLARKTIKKHKPANLKAFPKRSKTARAMRNCLLRLKNANFRYNTAKIQNNRSDISIKEIYHIFKIDKGFVGGKLESQLKSA